MLLGMLLKTPGCHSEGCFAPEESLSTLGFSPGVPFHPHRNDGGQFLAAMLNKFSYESRALGGFDSRDVPELPLLLNLSERAR